MLPEEKIVSRRKLKLKIVLCLAALLGIWVYGLSCYVTTLPTEPTDDQSVTDGIVILTGGTMRLETGIQLLNAEKAERLFISGVGQRTNLDQLLIHSGELPDNIIELKDRIDLGYEAQNTRGNAIEVAKWANEHGYKTLRLVTANYHMPRSYFELHSAMPDITLIQNPVFPGDIQVEQWWNHGVTKKIMISEYNKYLVSRVAAFFGM